MAKATTRTAAPKAAGFAGFGEADGKVGFKPWKDGQYAVEMISAERRREPDDPTGYVAVFMGEILPGGYPEQADERDPEGMNLYFTFWIPDPNDSDNGQYFERRVNEYKNFANAFGVKIEGSWFVSKKEEQEFVGKTGVAVLRTRIDRQTKEPDQRAREFFGMNDAKSEYADEAEEE